MNEIADPTPAETLKTPAGIANLGVLRRVVWVWSLTNIGLVLLSLFLPWTWGFSDTVTGVELRGLIAWVSQVAGPWTMLATLAVWVLGGFGWHLLFRRRGLDATMVQWLCTLFVALSAPVAAFSASEPTGRVASLIIVAGALSAGGYLLASAERLFLDRLLNAGPLPQYLWGVGAIGLAFFAVAAANGFGEPTARILVGFRLFTLTWLSCWSAEFVAVVLQRAERQA